MCLILLYFCFCSGPSFVAVSAHICIQCIPECAPCPFGILFSSAACHIFVIVCSLRKPLSGCWTNFRTVFGSARVTHCSEYNLIPCKFFVFWHMGFVYHCVFEGCVSSLFRVICIPIQVNLSVPESAYLMKQY